MTMLTGIDLSKFNTAALRWDELRRDHDFAILRAADGRERDGKFVERCEAAAGMIRGSYHRPKQGEPIAPQVDVYLEQLRRARLDEGTIVPCIDIEPAPDETLEPAWWLDAVPFWCEEIRHRYGSALAYTTPYFAGLLGPVEGVGHLWLAHHTDAPAPSQPRGWPDWCIWQHTAKGHTAGHGNKHWTDLNVARYLPLVGGDRLEARSTIPGPPRLPVDLSPTGLPTVGLVEAESEIVEAVEALERLATGYRALADMADNLRSEAEAAWLHVEAGRQAFLDAGGVTS